MPTNTSKAPVRRNNTAQKTSKNTTQRKPQRTSQTRTRALRTRQKPTTNQATPSGQSARNDRTSVSKREESEPTNLRNPLAAWDETPEPQATDKTSATSAPEPKAESKPEPKKSPEFSKQQKAYHQAKGKYLVGARTGLLGLDESKLGNDVAAMSVSPTGVAVGNAIFDNLNKGNLDDVSSQAISKMSDQQLQQLAQRPEGKALLQRMIGYSNSGHVSDFDGKQATRAGQFAFDKFGDMMSDKLPQAAKDAIEKTGSTHQGLKDGAGPIKWDEHSVTIDKMPPGMTPQQFLKAFAKDPNKMVNDGIFNTINRFTRRNEGQPKVGDIYDIDIFGPQNGDVVLRAVEPNFVEVATINTKKHGEHPEYGYRRFGFDENKDGSYNFYTRGVSRTQEVLGDNGFMARQGGSIQNYDWSRLVTGIGNNIERMGGKQRADSVRMQLGPR